MPLIDTFAHASLPRFLSAEELLRVMDDNDISASVLVTSETCPDLDELSRAATQWPDRFRSVGLAIGRSPDEVRDMVQAQLEAGFIGIRLPAARIVEQPGLLDLIGSANATPFVFGPDLFGEAAYAISEFLDRFATAVVCAPHFAGVADVRIFDRLPNARRLLEHPRFLIIFSRQGAHHRTEIGQIAHFLIQRVGWDRLMWGSEYPVCLWRDESYQDTVTWIDTIGVGPTDGQRKAFFSGNAKKYFFGQRRHDPRELGHEWDLIHLRKEAPVWLFPRTTIELPEEIHRTLLLTYLYRGGDREMRYSRFIAGLLADAARRLEG